MAFTNAERARRWRQRHPEEAKARRSREARKRTVKDRLYQRKRALIAQAFIDAAHAGGCVDCGIKHLGVLQSDHVRGTKIQDISRLIHGSFARLFAELDKCETRCANCHQLKSAREKRQKVAA